MRLIYQLWNIINSFVINKDRSLNNVIDDDVSEDDIDINQIREEFENYKEDIEYEGTKKLIKVYIIKRLHNIEIDNYRIELKYISDKNLQKDVLYVCDDIDDGDYYSSKYLKKIIDKQIIQNGNIYDLNNSSFQKKINQCKKIYNNVILSKETNNKIIKKSTRIKIT